MKEQWRKLKEWYVQLELRERRAVLAGGSALIFAIFYFAFWSPLSGRVSSMRERITAQQKTLAFMQDAEAKIKQLGHAGSQEKAALTPVTLLGLLQNQIYAAGLRDALQQMKQAGNDSVQLQFKNVSFDRLMVLLAGVISSHQVSVSALNAVAVGRPGLVDASVMLKLG